MKQVKLIALVLVTICLLAVPFAWSQGGNPPASTKESGATSGQGMTAAEQTGKSSGGNVEQQINTLTDQVVQALLKGDTSFFEKYYADDAMIIRGGDQYTKAKEIELFKSGAHKFEAYDVHKREIHTYGDTAVANMEASAKGLVNGHPFSGDYYVTRVWVKQKGNWKLVLYQVTPIAGAAHQ